MATATDSGIARPVDPAEFVDAVREDVLGGSPVELRVGELECVLPPDLAGRLLVYLDAMLGDERFLLQRLPELLTTSQAAEILGVSRPTVVGLVDTGRLPASRVGTHRRIAAADLLAYRAEVEFDADQAMDELVGLSEDLGLYSDD